MGLPAVARLYFNLYELLQFIRIISQFSHLHKFTRLKKTFTILGDSHVEGLFHLAIKDIIEKTNLSETHTRDAPQDLFILNSETKNESQQYTNFEDVSKSVPKYEYALFISLFEVRSVHIFSCT